MKLSFLKDYLEGKESISTLKSQISGPLREYREKSRIIGTSRPVILFSDLRDFTIGKEHVIKLCDTYLSGQMDEVEVDYLGSALQLVAAEKDFPFESKIVEEALSFLCDPEVNGTLTKESVQEIRESLS